MTSGPSETSASATPRTSRLLNVLRMDTVGGALLLAATVAALLWANSPASGSYFAIRDFELGYAPWHLQLSLGAWAADGLLAIFFFLVGLELKVEFTKGSLRSFSTAIVPISAAAGGVLVPAVIYAGLLVSSPDLLSGWAIPTATDIAFAVAVLALVGSHLPGALRVFLLTLAAVDDLLAITIIAIFYTAEISLLALAGALAAALVFGFVTWTCTGFFRRHAWAAWLILLPLGLVAWGFMHASGVHATIAGVILGFTVPALTRQRSRTVPLASEKGRSDSAADAAPGLAEILEHRLRPLSSGFAVPVFAFFAAGVAVGGSSGLLEAFSQSLTFAIIAALVLGKPLGILSSTWLISRFTRGSLDPSLKWIDLTGIGLLAGIGFTVSLLVAELSFTPGSSEHGHAKVAILTASLLAAALAAFVLSVRNRHYRRMSPH